MTPERWQEIDRIFDAALDLSSGDRELYVREACDGDDELYREVMSLLGSHDQSDGYFDNPPVDAVIELFPDMKEGDQAGRMIGAYRIEARLARGGMGVVYRAKRADGEYDQDVAIKLISAIHLSDEVMSRFRQERQILARLTHPNITRLLDGGRTESGLPYLVMEFVEGIPITEFCDQRRLSITERLRLFRMVCLAVQYAHQNLVVHRDLKPENIFVTPDGMVKLLDFGIAKILDAEAGDGITATMMMTPEFASPEQVRGEQITTASDVYCLGMVLYQLLTGRPAYRFRTRSMKEIVSVVTSEEPELPSAVDLDGQADSIASVREGTVEKLRSRLRGDVDSIVMSALRKDPLERYQSAELFAEEIRRHLEGKAVFARKPTRLYRTGKFIQRNRSAVLVAIIIFMSLIGGYLSTLRQARIAETSARENRRLAYAGQMHQAALAWQFANIAQLDDLLERTTPRPGEEDLRGFEWYYFNSVRRNNGEVRRIDHTSEVWAVAASPDGCLIAIGTDDGLIRLIEQKTGNEAAVLKGHTGHVIDLDFSPDGRRLISGSGDRRAMVWNVTTGTLIISLVGHTNWVTAVAFSQRDDSVVTGSRDGTVRFWDLSTGSEKRRLDGQANWVHDIAMSPDGKRFVTAHANNRNIQLWDLASGRIIARYEEGSLLASLVFSPDGKSIFAGGRDRRVKIIDAGTLALIKVLAPHSGEIKALALSPSGRLIATAASDRTVRLWDVDSGREVKRFKGHLGQVWDVAFSPDGRYLISSGDDYTARIWDVEAGDDVRIWATDSGIYAYAIFSPDDTVLAISHKDRIHLLTFRDNDFKSTSFLPSTGSLKAAFSPDGKRLVAGDVNNDLYISDLRVDSREVLSRAHAARINSIDYAPDGKTFATASYDRTVVIRDAATYRILKTIKHSSLVSGVVYHPRGMIIATAGYDNNARIWDLETGRELAALRGHTEPVLSLGFSPDGAGLATGSADSTIRLWDVATGREKAIFRAHGGHVKSLAFSPDGKRLATGGDDGLLRLWDVESGEEVVALSGHDNTIGHIAFSRDGRMLLSSSFDGMVRLLRVK